MVTGFKMPISIFGKPDISGMFGVGAIGQIQKYAIVAGASALTTLGLFGAKQYMEQKQEQKQGAITGGYTIYAYPDSNVTIEKPQTGSIDQTQTAAQTATQSQPDYMQYLLIGGLAIAAIYLLKKRK